MSSSLLYGHLSNTDTSLCPFAVRIGEARLQLVQLLDTMIKECPVS